MNDLLIQQLQQLRMTGIADRISLLPEPQVAVKPM